MTETSTETSTEVVAPDAETKALIKKAADQIVDGKMDIGEVLLALASGQLAVAEVDHTPPSIPEITETQREALVRLPDLYGKVNPTTARRLTGPELIAIVEERDLIDEILGFAENRKSKSIREILANHFDSLIPEAEREQARKDRNGHFAVKQEVSADGLGRKAQRIVSGGKPDLTIAQVEAAKEAGLIDQKTYLAITSLPENPRVLDQHKMAKAIKKDPDLLFTLARIAKPTTPSTTIKVVNDK